MRYSIDDLVKLQFAAQRLLSASLILQGVACSSGINDHLVDNMDDEIFKAMKSIDEVEPV